MLTYQDFLEADNRIDFIIKAINQHVSSPDYKTAVTADKYDKQQNETIYNYVKTIFTSTGSVAQDFTAANNKIACNFFHRLNTQRCMYSLGNGVSFSQHKEKRRGDDGQEITIDTTKERLGLDFDTMLKDGAYKALIHGVSFGFWNLDRLFIFPLTEFVPLWDETSGALMAGIRFWQLDDDKPVTAVLYEVDGYTVYRGDRKSGTKQLQEIESKRGYKQIYTYSEADGYAVVGAENYSALPIVPLWGSRLHQSTLIGMQRAIDSYDLIRSGFANDLTDCAQIYWILENCSGMTEGDIAKFRDRMKIQHLAIVDTDNSGIKPYTQEIPFQARSTYLDAIRAGIYEDFGGLDVHTIAAGATNDHIDAAYQPMDEEADDFEYQIIKFVQQVLTLIGIEDTPVFKRNRISNQKEQVDMVALESQWLDEETILRLLPNIDVDQVNGILARREVEAGSRFQTEVGQMERESQNAENEPRS